MGSQIPPRSRAQERETWLRKKMKKNSVDLSEKRLNNDDAAIIADELKRNSYPLKMLFLSHNKKIGNAGIAAIADALHSNETLEQLFLSDCKIGDQGAAAFKEALKVNKTLRTLELALNKIGEQGAISLADALTTNSTLVELDLDNNKIGQKGTVAFANALTVNATLQILNLIDNKVKDAGAVALAGSIATNKALRNLFLEDNRIGSDGAVAFTEALKENKTLEVLSLGSNDMIGDIGATAFSGALKVNQTLKKLDLSNCGISVIGSVDIADALKQNSTLLKLEIGHNDEIGDEGAVSFVGAIHLHSLVLNSSNISAEGIRTMVEGLKQANSTLKSLHLDGNSVGNVGAIAIAGWLKQNTTLEDLYLGECEIGAVGAVALADAVKKNLTIEMIDLDDNEGAGVAIALADIESTLGMDRTERYILALRNNGNVTAIDSFTLSDDLEYTFSSDKARELGASLQGNTVVTELKILLDEEWAEQDIGGDLDPILQYIEQSPTLSRLSYILRRRDEPASSVVVQRFFEAVANRPTAVDFKLIVDVKWLDDRDNLNIFGSLMRKTEYSFVKDLALIHRDFFGRFVLDEDDFVDVLDSAQFVAALMATTTLESLSIEIGIPCTKFLKAWKAKARNSKIQSFSLTVKDPGTFRQLLDTLPSLFYLEEFRLELVGRRVEGVWRTQQGDWLRALKQNGSMRRVELTFDRAPQDPQLLELHQQRVQMYCQRNELLPARIAKPRLPVAATARATNATADNNNAAEDRTPVRLYPALFHHALQCPNRGLGWVLAGMAALEDRVPGNAHTADEDAASQSPVAAPQDDTNQQRNKRQRRS